MTRASGTGQGTAIWAADQPLHEMSNVADSDVARAGGNARDGGRWKALVAPETVGKANMIVGLYWLSKGERHLLHHHETAAEFYYVVSGSGRFTLGSREIHGKPGLTLYIPAGVKHAVVNDGEEHLCIMWGFDCGDLEDAQMVWDE
jgi:oxalate decarboxylase/phosphoglucose isomerase-like protein (cupin superfamily)